MGCGCLGEYPKKEKFVRKNFFKKILNKVPERCEKMSFWYQQTDVEQQEMKDLVAVSYDNVWELLSKFEI